MNTEDFSNTIGSERLRRAIERNKKKKLKKNSEINFVRSNVNYQRNEIKNSNLPKNLFRASERPKSEMSLFGASENDYKQRQSVYKAGDKVEFVRNPIGPKTNFIEKFFQTFFRFIFSPFKKIINLKDAKSVFILMGWAFNFFVLLRLIFSENGVNDFVNMESILNNKRAKIKNVLSENQDLRNTIQKLETDSKYQKKIARDHLGVIANDEYLVLFANPSKQ